MSVFPMRRSAQAACCLLLSLAVHTCAGAETYTGTGTTTVTVIPAAPSEDRMRWSADHPFSLGVRGGAWQNQYTEPGLGGQLRFQPWAHVGLEGFLDNFAHLGNGQLRRDHVNGFSLFFPVVQTERVMVAPQFGACDDFQFVQPFRTSGPSVSDVLIGLHAGGEIEARIGGGLSVEAEVELYGYMGHGADVQRWTSQLSSSLSGQLVGVGVVAMNYYF
jgi:hypothetical protein